MLTFQASRFTSPISSVEVFSAGTHNEPLELLATVGIPNNATLCEIDEQVSKSCPLLKGITYHYICRFVIRNLWWEKSSETKIKSGPVRMWVRVWFRITCYKVGREITVSNLLEQFPKGHEKQKKNKQQTNRRKILITCATYLHTPLEISTQRIEKSTNYQPILWSNHNWLIAERSNNNSNHYR